MSAEKSPFAAIIDGEEPGNIIVKDDEKRFALIECAEPEAAVHWLAVPYEFKYGTEEMEKRDRERFIDLVEFAVLETKKQMEDFPILNNGFSVKFHVGAFETIPHAKLHILSTE